MLISLNLFLNAYDAKKELEIGLIFITHNILPESLLVDV